MATPFEARRHIQQWEQVYKTLDPNSKSAQQLKAKIDGLRSQYGIEDAPDPKEYFDPKFITEQFDLAKMGLSRRMGNTANIATMNAGAQASSLGLLNKAGFTTGVASNVRQSFLPEFTKLDIGKNAALQGNNAQLYAALSNLFQSNIQNEWQQQQYSDQQAGGMEWLKAALPLAGLALPGGGSIGGAILFPSQYT